MNNATLDGAIALLIALLILSIIAEKAITLIRSYLKQFRVLSIIICTYLIFCLWFNSGVKPENYPVSSILLFILCIIFHAGLYFNYNNFYNRYKISKQNQQAVYLINGAYSILFHVALKAFTTFPAYFILWNIVFFSLLLLLVQSYFNGELFGALRKGKPADKTVKEIEVSFFSISIGALIAFFFRADFFEILKSALNSGKSMDQILTWNGKFPFSADSGAIIFSPDFGFSLYQLLGILITGFFLSYGSRFFHDTLEYLLEVKNYKKTLNDKQSYDPNNIEDVDTMIKVGRPEMAGSIITKYEKDLRKNHPNIKSIFAGQSFAGSKKTDSIIIHLKDDQDLNFPDTLPYKLPSGKLLDFPVEVITNVGTARAQNKPGIKIANVKDVGKKGTLGCIVRKNDTEDQYVLTCSHVAFSGSSEDRKGIINDKQSIRAYTGKVVYLSKNIHYARRDSTNDTALLEPIIKVSNEGNIEKERPLNELSDQLAEVSFHGAFSGFQEGRIHKVCTTDYDNFDYDDGERVEYTGLIVFGKFEKKEWSTLSQAGDSGSILLDKNKCAIGIVIGGNERFTYALPIMQILKDANCTIDLT